jgi:hypothetical protein
MRLSSRPNASRGHWNRARLASKNVHDAASNWSSAMTHSLDSSATMIRIGPACTTNGKLSLTMAASARAV